MYRSPCRVAAAAAAAMMTAATTTQYGRRALSQQL